MGMLLKDLRIRGPRERLIEPALRRLHAKTLQEALQEAAQIDKIVKGLRASEFAGDPWDALLHLGLKIARK